MASPRLSDQLRMLASDKLEDLVHGVTNVYGALCMVMDRRLQQRGNLYSHLHWRQAGSLCQRKQMT